MNLLKSLDYFNPLSVRERIHIIGCGSVGSTVAENLVRYGLTKITLYDDDRVEAHNIANQMFVNDDIGRSKVEALADLLISINPEIKPDLKIVSERYTDQRLSGYVFLCVDDIDVRREISEQNRGNIQIKGLFDFRTRLTDAQHYAIDWANPKEIDSFIKAMNFSHEEVMEETPMSACGRVLGVAATVRLICGFGVANFINWIKSGELKRVVQIDTENMCAEGM